jgi:hypothetical protein
MLFRPLALKNLSGYAADLPPIYLQMIVNQGLIPIRTTRPLPRAGKPVFQRIADQSGADRVHVDVLDLLPESILAENFERVGMMLPNGVLMIALANFASEFEKRALKIVFFQKLNDAPGGYAVHQPERILHFLFRSNEQVNVVDHDHVGEDEDAVVRSGLRAGVAEDLL